MIISAYADRLTLVESFATVLPGVRFVPSLGHTDNHHSIEVISEGQKLLILGDAWSNRVSYTPNYLWPDVPR